MKKPTGENVPIEDTANRSSFEDLDNSSILLSCVYPVSFKTSSFMSEEDAFILMVFQIKNISVRFGTGRYKANRSNFFHKLLFPMATESCA